MRILLALWKLGELPDYKQVLDVGFGYGFPVHVNNTNSNTVLATLGTLEVQSKACS